MKLFQLIQPRPELKPYITKIWLFENDFKLTADNSLIAPNARAKIIIPYKNALTTTDRGKTTVCKEADLYFIGIRDVPVTLGSPPGATGSIGLELTTTGAYRFLNLPMSELTNTLFSFTELYGKAGRQLKELMINTDDPLVKVEIIQNFLVSRLIAGTRGNMIVDYAVNLILAHNGLIEIKAIERKTGYSKRYLDYLFKDHLGISPKSVSTIFRFQKFYRDITDMQSTYSIKNEMHELYYDQAHFIKEFKRYTGYAPGKFAKLNNTFGRNF